MFTNSRTVCSQNVAPTTILMLLCFAAFASAFNFGPDNLDEKQVGDHCRTVEGIWGVCTLSRNCGTFALNPALSAGDVCASSGRHLLVCCRSGDRRQPNRRPYGGTVAAEVVRKQVLVRRSTTTRGTTDKPWWLAEGTFYGESSFQPPTHQHANPWWAETGARPLHGEQNRPNRPYNFNQASPNRPYEDNDYHSRPNRPYDSNQNRPNRPDDGNQGAPARLYDAMRPDDEDELILFPDQTGRPKPRPDETPYIDPPPRTTPHRISETKCDEYSRQVWINVTALPLTPDPEPISSEVPKCDYNSVRLIVGGQNTTPGEFPHMAALGYREGKDLAWNCGGSLISEYYVLTAAHCIYTASGTPVVVRLGEFNLRSNTDGAQPVDYLVSKVIRHPEYKVSAKYNDIALLRLSRRVIFNKFIRPACLYTRDNFFVNKTTAIGWGRIDYAESASDILLKVSLSIIDNKKCNQLYRSDSKTSTLSKGIISSMLCAGELEGGKDTCQGDSGGPIQISSSSNQCIHYIIGITSFGKFCAGKNSPGVYTRVSYYVPWIESVVWPTN